MATTMDSDVIATNQLKECWITSLILLDKMFSIDSSSVVIIQSKLKSEVALYDFCDVNPSTMIGQARLVGRNVMEKDLQTTVDLLSMNIIKNTPVIEKVTNPAVVQAAPPIVTKTVVPAQPAVVQAAPPMVTKTVVPAQPAVVQAAPHNITKTVVPAQAAVVQAAPQNVTKTVVTAQPAVVRAAPQMVTKTVVPAQPAVVQAAPQMVTKTVVPAQPAVVQAAPQMVTKTVVPAQPAVVQAAPPMDTKTVVSAQPAVVQAAPQMVTKTVVPARPAVVQAAPPMDTKTVVPAQPAVVQAAPQIVTKTVVPAQPAVVQAAPQIVTKTVVPAQPAVVQAAPQNITKTVVPAQAAVVQAAPQIVSKTVVPAQPAVVQAAPQNITKTVVPARPAVVQAAPWIVVKPILVPAQAAVVQAAPPMVTKTGVPAKRVILRSLLKDVTAALVRPAIGQSILKIVPWPPTKEPRPPPAIMNPVQSFLYITDGSSSDGKLLPVRPCLVKDQSFDNEEDCSPLPTYDKMPRQQQAKNKTIDGKSGVKTTIALEMDRVAGSHSGLARDSGPGNAAMATQNGMRNIAVATRTGGRVGTLVTMNITNTTNKALIKTFLCEHCGKRFNNRNYRNKHRRTHNVKKFLCGYCGKAFHTARRLRMHESIHTGVKEFQCEYCSKGFNLRYVLNRHIQIHHTNTSASYSCEVCLKSYKKKSVLAEHKQQVHSPNSERRHKCQYCDKAFWTSTKLRFHTRTHTKEKPHTCEHCSRPFATLSQLKTHLKLVHNEPGEKPVPQFKCSQCDKCYLTRQFLEDHLNVHTGATPYGCRECEQKFATPSARRYHEDKHRQARVSSGELGAPAMDEQAGESSSKRAAPAMDSQSAGPKKKRQAGPFICLLCEDTLVFLSHWTLLNHELQHKVDGKFQCIHCEDVFIEKDLLLEHMQAAHGNIINLKCGHCHLRFTTLAKLKYHEYQKHIKVTKEMDGYQCSVCGKILRSRQACVDHENGHTGVTPYSCPHPGCQAAFSTRSRCQKHHRQHKQENKCEICEKECEGQAKLKDHMNTHTGATPYRCRHCPKEFSTRKSWLTHEKKHAMSTSKPKPTQAYHCIVCNKSFRQKCFYSDHLNLHTGATPYACPHCQQAFATKYRLHNHSLSCKMDTEKLVFQCSFCERTFYSRRSCDDHINTHTGDRPYKCRHVNCELAFHTYSTRKQHERRHVLRDGTGHRDV